MKPSNIRTFETATIQSPKHFRGFDCVEKIALQMLLLKKTKILTSNSFFNFARDGSLLIFSKTVSVVGVKTLSTS